ncbi:MAG: hypothetical protein MHM6MM_005227 [Cercozoa sp. M6MM]
MKLLLGAFVATLAVLNGVAASRYQRTGAPGEAPPTNPSTHPSTHREDRTARENTDRRGYTRDTVPNTMRFDGGGRYTVPFETMGGPSGDMPDVSRPGRNLFGAGMPRGPTCSVESCMQALFDSPPIGGMPTELLEHLEEMASRSRGSPGTVVIAIMEVTPQCSCMLNHGSHGATVLSTQAPSVVEMFGSLPTGATSMPPSFLSSDLAPVYEMLRSHSSRQRTHTGSASMPPPPVAAMFDSRYGSASARGSSHPQAPSFPGVPAEELDAWRHLSQLRSGHVPAAAERRTPGNPPPTSLGTRTQTSTPTPTATTERQSEPSQDQTTTTPRTPPSARVTRAAPEQAQKGESTPATRTHAQHKHTTQDPDDEVASIAATRGGSVAGASATDSPTPRVQ